MEDLEKPYMVSDAICLDLYLFFCDSYQCKRYFGMDFKSDIPFDDCSGADWWFFAFVLQEGIKRDGGCAKEDGEKVGGYLCRIVLKR